MKILIGCPTSSRYDYCIDEWVQRVKKIINHSKNHQIDYLLVDNSKDDDFYKKLKEKGINIIHTKRFDNIRETIVNSRNILRDKVISDNYDYFFSLEQDVMPEETIIEKLLKSKKDIVSAYYAKPILVGLKDKVTGIIKNAYLEFPLVFIDVGQGRVKRALPQDVKDKGIIKVGGFGIGCVLINKEVLEKIKFRTIENNKAFDDMIFCDDVEKEGYQLYLDSNIQVRHLHVDWSEDPNLHKN